MEIPLERAVPLVELPSLGRVRGPQAPGQMEDRLQPYRLAIILTCCVPRCLGSKGPEGPEMEHGVTTLVLPLGFRHVHLACHDD